MRSAVFPNARGLTPFGAQVLSFVRFSPNDGFGPKSASPSGLVLRGGKRFLRLTGLSPRGLWWAPLRAPVSMLPMAAKTFTTGLAPDGNAPLSLLCGTSFCRLTDAGGAALRVEGCGISLMGDAYICRQRRQ